MTCVLLVGCDTDDERRSARDTKSPPSSSAESTSDESEACRARHAAVRWAYADLVDEAVDLVYGSSAGVSEEAVPWLRVSLERAAVKVDERCRTRPESLVAFQQDVERLTETPLDRAEAGDLVAAYAEWVGRTEASRRVRALEDKVERCDEYVSGIKASYEVFASPARYGKDMWVDWRVRNDTAAAVVVVQGGSLWARGVLRRYRGEWDPDRQAWAYHWGGSSADPDSRVRPGTEASARAVVVMGYLPMRPDGIITDAVPELYVSPAGRMSDYGWCPVAASGDPSEVHQRSVRVDPH